MSFMVRIHINININIVVHFTIYPEARLKYSNFSRRPRGSIFAVQRYYWSHKISTNVIDGLRQITRCTAFEET